MRSLRHIDSRWFLAVAAAGIAIVVIALVAVVSRSDSDASDAGTTLPADLPVMDGGYLRAPAWDDRHLAPAEKLANPIVNPRWEPFARCMEAAGFDVRNAEGGPFLQADLDRLVEHLNADGPLVTNEGGRFVVHHTPETRAYADCYARTLGVFSEDLYTILTPEELERARANGDAPKDGPPAEGTLTP